MSTPASDTLPEIELFRRQTRAIHGVVRMNTDGLTHEDSLIQPEPGGNCLNWVVGHLVNSYESLLPRLGRKPVLGEGTLARYARGSAALTDPAEATDLDDLLAAWDDVSNRVESGLADLTSEDLDAPAPGTPGSEGEGTLRSYLTFTLFHQAYHAGQTGLLRRLAGKDGAIK